MTNTDLYILTTLALLLTILILTVPITRSITLALP